MKTGQVMRKLGNLVLLCFYGTFAYLLLNVVKKRFSVRIHLPENNQPEQVIRSAANRTITANITYDDKEDVINNTVGICTQSVRQHVLDSYCKGERSYLSLLDDPSNFKFMLVDERLKAIYCAIPKAGSTSWKTFFARVAGGSPLSHQAEDEQFLSNLGLRYLNIFPKSAIQQKLESYFKFTIVRHPMERLVSAYRDKIGRYNSYGDDIRKEIVEKVMKKDQQYVSVKAAKLTRITFDTFVQYVNSKQPGSLDHHWEDFDNICHPCQIRYNYIGKLETMDSDAENIIAKLQSTTDRHNYNLENLNRKYSYSKNNLGEFKSNLFDFHNLTAGEKEKISRLYKDDMSKFGYTWDDKNLQSACVTSIFQNKCC